MSEKYTIDNAKNDIQNLQSQNLFDFQEIKRLDGLINDYEKRVLQAININNQINKKIQYDYENFKKSVLDENNQIQLNEKIEEIQSQITLILDRINRLEDNSSSTPTVKTYSVTYNLNGVTSSNNTTTITENSNYNTTLTADNNLTINSVSVTLGGVNVTDIVYSNGVINIANVSGNIVITVTAIIADSNSIVICKNAGLASTDGSETESATRIATDFIPVSISGNLSIYSKTTENYKYLIRYYDINKTYVGTGGSEWTLDGTISYFNAPGSVNFTQVKFLRLVYKSKYSDGEPINTISGTIEIEEDGNVKTLTMEYK